MKRFALTALAVCLLLPVLIIATATGGIGLAQPAPAALADIPADYLLLYEQAGLAYEVPWEVLAGIGKVECDHGRNPDPACWREGAENYAGAGGPMQFLAATWARYGLDADGDGRADRWSPADAIFAAANYLRASGAPDDIAGAVYAYNHSNAYVEQVLAWADRYRDEAASGAHSAAPAAAGNRGTLGPQLLADPRIELLPEAAGDVRAGRVDPRVLRVLLWLSQSFRLAHVGPFVSGHSYYVHGSDRPSNHAFGRAVDIGAIKGEPVSAGNAAARAAALALASLPPALRPDEVGSPFPLGEPGYFTDADHQDHVHLGYDR